MRGDEVKTIAKNRVPLVLKGNEDANSIKYVLIKLHKIQAESFHKIFNTTLTPKKLW